MKARAASPDDGPEDDDREETLGECHGGRADGVSDQAEDIGALAADEIPTLLPMRMNAADTSASSAIADWTPLTAVVPTSRTTAEMDTFMIDVSTTSTNIAIANKMASGRFIGDSSVVWMPPFSSAAGTIDSPMAGDQQNPVATYGPI